MREDPFSTPNTPRHTPPPPTHPIKSSLAMRCSSSLFPASFVHLSQPPTHLPSLGLFSLHSRTCTNLHLATSYVVLFLPVLYVVFTTKRLLEMLCECECGFTCACILTHTWPIFSALQYRCVGSSHLWPQMKQNVCVDVWRRAKGQP